MHRILGAMTPASAAAARELMRHAAQSAGGLMVREFLAFPSATSVHQVLDTLTLDQTATCPAICATMSTW